MAGSHIHEGKQVMAAAADSTPTTPSWMPSEQVRRWIYGVVAALLPILAFLHFISGGDVQLWLDLATAVLGLGTPLMALLNVPKAQG